MNKHTKGKWVVNYDEVCVRSNADDQSFGMLVPIAAVMDENQEANAQLIAAAPEMIEALLAISEFIPITTAAEGGASAYSANVHAADLVRAAIAKATGAA